MIFRGDVGVDFTISTTTPHEPGGEAVFGMASARAVNVPAPQSGQFPSLDEIEIRGEVDVVTERHGGARRDGRGVELEKPSRGPVRAPAAVVVGDLQHVVVSPFRVPHDGAGAVVADVGGGEGTPVVVGDVRQAP